MHSFLKSIGVTDDLLEHLDQVSLAFQRPALLWVGLIVLGPVAYFVYRRQQSSLATVPRKFRIVLTVTRVLVLAILICVVAGPYLELDLHITKRPIVALLFDSSQSMQLPAGPFASEEELLAAAVVAGKKTPDGDLDSASRAAAEELTRADLADTAVRSAADSLIEPLRKDFDVRFYQFSRGATQFAFDSDRDAPDEAEQPGRASYIGDSINDVFEDAAGRQVAGIVLLSDGQNTGGVSPSQAARAAAEAGTPIYAAPLGSAERLPDVSVIDVYTSGMVALGDTVSVHVTLESQGFDGRPITIELKDGDELLATQQTVARDAEHQRIELTFEATTPGPRYLTVNVPPFEEEVDQLRANNTDTALVTISDEKLRVLLVDGFPRWDFRFVKNAIRRDNGLAGRVEDSPDVIVETEWRRWPVEQQTASLPQTLDEFAEYHTVILGDVSPELVDSGFQDLLARAVRERAVGLIVEAGPQSMPHRYDSSFQELLPVRMQPGEAGVEAPVYNPFEILVSADGLIHETMRLYDDPGRNHRVWSRMPDYYWCAAVDKAAPGATVLAWNPKLEGRFGRTPLIAFHYAGDGRVMFLGTDSTWSWRQMVGDRFFYKFWGQAVRFVSRKNESDGQQNSIAVRPIRAQPGEEAQIELNAFNADGSPVDMPSRDVELLSPGNRQTIKVPADDSRDGLYQGRFTPEVPGIHRLVYQPADGEPVEATIQVLTSPEEYRHPNPNRPTLELLASTTGGDVLAISELGLIPERLQGETESQSLHREASLWDNWLTLTLLILVYSIDVGIRRLTGLV